MGKQEGENQERAIELGKGNDGCVGREDPMVEREVRREYLVDVANVAGRGERGLHEALCVPAGQCVPVDLVTSAYCDSQQQVVMFQEMKEYAAKVKQLGWSGRQTGEMMQVAVSNQLQAWLRHWMMEES